jgi:hypothetical protein
VAILSVRFAEKLWLKILFVDLLWEKNTVPPKKTSWKIRIIRQTNRAGSQFHESPEHAKLESQFHYYFNLFISINNGAFSRSILSSLPYYPNGILCCTEWRYLNPRLSAVNYSLILKYSVFRQKKIVLSQHTSSLTKIIEKHINFYHIKKDKL